MQRWFSGVLAAALAACGPVSTAPSGSGGTGGPPPVTHKLTIHTVHGAVHSSSPAFDCSADCSQDVTAGAAVRLLAIAGSGYSFSGWQGACTGSGDCTFTMDGDRDVTAVFAALPPPPPGSARITVVLTGPGSGTVGSNPAGINCPGGCTATVNSGATLVLSAQPNAGSTFAGWGGACSGPGACSVTATTDQTVWADFELSAPPPPSSCAGLAPPDAPAMQQYVHAPDAQYYACLSPVGDAHGTLILPRAFHDASSHGSQLEFVSVAAGTLLRDAPFASETPRLAQQPSGLLAWGDPGHLYPYSPGIIVASWDSAANANGVIGPLHASSVVPAADPRGGLLLAGEIASSMQGADAHVAEMYDGGGTSLRTRWGPRALASPGPVFGAGVDLLGRSLVITGGGSGTISAEWFDADGTPLTGAFTLLTGFTAGPATWFEGLPLIGGGLVVRRMDQTVTDGTIHSTALVTLASGSATPQPAPAWMTARPDVRLQVARGGKAYVTLPYGAKGVACSQRAEIVAPDGTSCGTRDYAIASGTCDTLDLAAAADGTIVQQLPQAMETVTPTSHRSCTWRWWAGAVK